MRFFLGIPFLLWATVSLAADFAVDSKPMDVYSIEISGEITQGDSARLLEIFAERKHFTIATSLRTQGGDVQEAQRLGGIFRESYAAVIAERGCDLPCFVALVGGVSRSVSADLILSMDPSHEIDLKAYFLKMELPPDVIAQITGPQQPTTVSVNLFNQEIGESPATLEELVASKCGQLSPKEMEDFRRMQAARFQESLLALKARAPDRKDLDEIIAKYEALAREADKLKIPYQKLLASQWQEISTCRRELVEKAQSSAFVQFEPVGEELPDH